MFRTGSTRKTRWCRFHFRISRIKNVINKKTSPWKTICFIWWPLEPKLLNSGQTWSQNVARTRRELTIAFFKFFLAIILLEIIAFVCEKITIFSKFHLWWPLVISILSWPENGLGKTLRSCHFISNAVYHLSLSSEVFEIRWGFWSPLPATNWTF